MPKPLLRICEGYAMKKNILIEALLGAFILLGVTACASIKSLEPKLVGNDRDSHGCIGSAGYQWCKRQNKCERSWELAAEKGFANTPEAFNAYCSGVE